MRSKGTRGFTTLELLIILVIIGFFVAMIAPRLAGLFDDATRKISDSNKKDSMRFSRMWQVDRGNKEIGNNLINLVYYTGDDTDGDLDGGLGNYDIPMLAEQSNDEDGAEWISYRMMRRLKLYRHVLSEEEAQELIDMGLTRVQMLDRDYTEDPAQNKLHRVQEGMVVLMIGAGREDDDNDAFDEWVCHAEDDYDDWADDVLDGNVQDDLVGDDTIPDYRLGGPGGAPDDGLGIAYPEYLYRIVMGVGEESSLVKDGIVDNAGISPDAISREDHYRLNKYIMVLPRLKATNRSVVNHAGGFAGSNDCPKRFVVTRNVDGAEERDTLLVADRLDQSAQAIGDFEVISPEGYKLLDTVEELWLNVGGPDGTETDNDYVPGT